jgi:hypothetical protein
MSGMSLNNRALFVVAGHQILIISASRNLVRSVARSATSSRCQYVARTIGKSIAAVMKNRGGAARESIRLLLPARFGLKPIRCRVRRAPSAANKENGGIHRSDLSQGRGWRAHHVAAGLRAHPGPAPRGL